MPLPPEIKLRVRGEQQPRHCPRGRNQTAGMLLLTVRGGGSRGHARARRAVKEDVTLSCLIGKKSLTEQYGLMVH